MLPVSGVSPFELIARAGVRSPLVIGAGVDGSGTFRGESRAPMRLRELDLAGRLGATDFRDLEVAVEDSARDPISGIRGYSDLLGASRTIADAVASALAAGWRPIVIGGCCSILPGALAGARRHLGPLSLAFVDGHLDLFDAESTSTGEAAGMALAIVIGHGPPGLTKLAGDAPLVDQRDVIAIGDGDHQRRVALHAPGPSQLAPDLRVIDCREVADRGAEEVGIAVAEGIGAGSAPFWLHFDLDVIDAEEMPAVSFPVATGLSWRQVADLTTPLLSSPRLVGATVTDYNTDLDERGKLGTQVVDALRRGLMSGG